METETRKRYLLFDLDGTLTDPKEGICSCVQYALASFGIDEPDLDRLEPFIGPPLRDSFMERYGFSGEDAERAVAKYRERFAEKGLYENDLYPGVHQMLRSLKDAGFHLAVASSKPQIYVEKILEHFRLAKYFEVVVGGDLEGKRDTKSAVLAEALRQLFPDGDPRLDEVYLIGDRKFDVEGAHEAGVECVAVAYGYGSMEELKEAKADYIVRSVPELRKLLLREAGEDGLLPAERASGQQGRASAAGKGFGGAGASADAKKRPGAFGFRRQFGFADIWRMLYLFLLFALGKTLVQSLISLVLVSAEASLPEGISAFLFLRSGETGEAESFTGNASALLTVAGSLAGMALIWKSARKLMERAHEEMHLTHLIKAPAVQVLCMGIATAGCTVAFNLLFALSGLTAASAGYQEVAQVQYSASFLLGLIVYGFVTPAAEELLFRGVLYNFLKNFFYVRPAIVLTAVLFAFYHGNSAQGMYAFLMGCLLAYAYEYFGTFRAPLAVHMGANVLAYCMTYLLNAVPALNSWALCGIGAALAAGAVFALTRMRKLPA